MLAHLEFTTTSRVKNNQICSVFQPNVALYVPVCSQECALSIYYDFWRWDDHSDKRSIHSYFVTRRSRRDIVLASSVRPSISSVRPHLLSVRNHISVPIGQIGCILGISDQYHEQSTSYKFRHNQPIST